MPGKRNEELAAETGRPQRRRLEPERRRADILDAATALLAQRGYWALTMVDVAREVGVTVQGILHYFPSKDALMLGVLERRDRIDIEAAAPTGHPVADIPEFVLVIDRLVQRNATRPELIRLYTVLAAESLDAQHPAHEYFNERYGASIDTLARLIESWHPDPRSLALTIVSVLEGFQLYWLRDPHLDLVDLWRTWASTYFRCAPWDGAG